MGAGASRTHSDTGMRRSKSHPPTASPSKHKQHRALPPLPIQETAPPLPPPRNSTQTPASNMNSCRHPRRVNSEPEPKNSLFALIPTDINGFGLNDPVLPQQASEEEFAEIYRVGMSILGENPDKHTNSRKIYTMVRKKEHSKNYPRFEQFVAGASVKPSDVQTSTRQSHLPHIGKIHIAAPTAETYTSEHIEYTLKMILERLPSYSDQSVKPCPLGMSKDERVKFTLSLDLMGDGVIIGRGWRVFAENVIEILPDDMLMIENFSYSYRYPVVEVLLEHWYRLDQLRSPKCRLHATRQTIIDVLRKQENLGHVLEKAFPGTRTDYNV